MILWMPSCRIHHDGRKPRGLISTSLNLFLIEVMALEPIRGCEASEVVWACSTAKSKNPPQLFRKTVAKIEAQILP
jgi:hypothetical protein